MKKPKFDLRYIVDYFGFNNYLRLIVISFFKDWGI